jgi:hypothetical protein
LFFKNIPPRIDRTIAGLFTCAIVICYLPYGAPARVGAPFLFIAYRAALSFWNRKPKPTTTPKPPASAPSSRTPPTAKKPAATAALDKATATPPKTGEGQPPLKSVSGPDSKLEKEKAAPPAALDPSAKPSAAVREGAAPLSTSTSKPPAAKPEEKKSEAAPASSSPGPAPKEGILEKLNQHQGRVAAFREQAKRLDLELRKNLTNIQVKVKITYLPQQETASEPKAKAILKEPEVIAATFYLNSHFLFNFPKEMISTIQKLYSVPEKTSFCWVFLAPDDSKQYLYNKPSLFPFEYLPIETLRPLAGKKKNTTLKFETSQQIFEIEFIKASCRETSKCLQKLDKCTKHETMLPDVCPILLNPEKDIEGIENQSQAVLIMNKCYLTPFEKK